MGEVACGAKDYKNMPFGDSAHNVTLSGRAQGMYGGMGAVCKLLHIGSLMLNLHGMTPEGITHDREHTIRVT